VNNSNRTEKPSFDEIATLFRKHEIGVLFSMIEEAMEGVERKFYLKVTKERNPRADFTIIISGRVVIDLVPKPEGHRPATLAVIPAPVIHDASSTSPTTDDRVIFIPVQFYEQLLQDAQTIYSMYCQQGHNFGWIPCAWFSQLALVQFITGHLWKNRYFQERLSSPHIETGTDWSREECA
jgi:hypothetical protein